MSPVVWTDSVVENGRPRAVLPARRWLRRQRDGHGAQARGPAVALAIGAEGSETAQSAVLNLARGLRRRGYDIVPVVAASGSRWLAARLLEGGFRVERIDVASPLEPASVASLAAVLRNRGVSLLHAHEYASAVCGASAAGGAGIPCVITMHGGREHERHVYRRLALRWAVERARAVVAVSASTARGLGRSLWMSPARIGVVPNGVRAGRASGRGMAVRHELGLTPKEALVLSVGRLCAGRGYETLLYALALLARSRPSLRWRAVLVGEGDEHRSLERLRKELGLVEHVSLLGFRSDVPDLMDAADVFVLPSVVEAPPFPVLEAMVAGRPVVATRAGGLPEVVRDGDTGLLVPPGRTEALCEALARVLDDAGFRLRLGTAARRVASSRYTVDAMVDAYERTYGWWRDGLERPCTRVDDPPSFGAGRRRW